VKKNSTPSYRNRVPTFEASPEFMKEWRALNHDERRAFAQMRRQFEAMASGPAILAFGAGGVSDLLRHGEEGLLCSPAGPDDWFRYAQALAENPPLRTRLGERARSAVLVRTWEAVFDTLFADYAALLIGEQAGIPSLSARISVPGLQSKEGMHSAKERIA
jgi:hypothetical protein